MPSEYKMCTGGTDSTEAVNTERRDAPWIRLGKERFRESMELKKSGNTEFLQFPAFSRIPGLVHGFSTRHGGKSQGFLSSMNFSFDRGDDPEAVRYNYSRMAEAVGVSFDSFVVAKQTHTTNIRVVTEADKGAGVLFPRPYTDIDGLMTDVPGITLVTFHADCIPVWIADPKHRAAALLHAGWKGTVDGIQRIAVRKMTELYGSRPEELIACIGPGVCGSCYEVGEDVAEHIRELLPDEPSVLFGPHPGPDGLPRIQLDLMNANALILLKTGLREEQIHCADICTRCNAPHLFSHRAHGVKRGLNAAFFGWKV